MQRRWHDQQYTETFLCQQNSGEQGDHLWGLQHWPQPTPAHQPPAGPGLGPCRGHHQLPHQLHDPGPGADTHLHCGRSTTYPQHCLGGRLQNCFWGSIQGEIYFYPISLKWNIWWFSSYQVSGSIKMYQE